MKVKKFLTGILQNIEIKELIWENPNQNVSFNAQDVTLRKPVSRFNRIEVVAKARVEENNFLEFISSAEKYSIMNEGTMYNDGWFKYHRQSWWVSDTTWHFDNNFYQNITGTPSVIQSNSRMIPLKIYGYRKIGRGTQ